MSHFTVLVIGEDVEGQLAPYDENTEVEQYREAWTDEDIRRFEEHYKISVAMTDPVSQVLTKMKDWNGCENVYDAEADEFYRLSTYNPQSKFDWYSVGGRWTGFFKVKEGKAAMLGTPGVFGNEPEHDGDVVLKGDIDFDGMRETAAAEAHATYDKYEEAVKGIDMRSYRPWSSFLDDVKEEKILIDQARTLYHEQAYVIALKGADLMPWFSDREVHEIYADRVDFVRRYVDGVAVPYAIVKDGEWFGKGDMGWWGMSSNDLDENEWSRKVQELYDGLPDDTLLTLVDCHI